MSETPGAELAKAIRSACASREAASAAAIRVEIAAPGLDPLAWLAGQTDQKRGYWADRDGVREVALVGEVDEIKGQPGDDFSSWSHALSGRLDRAMGDVRYYGGFRFGPPHPSDHAWAPFGVYRFILPRLELVRREGGETVFAMNVVRDAQGNWPAVSDEVFSTGPKTYQPPPLPTVLARSDEPGPLEWVRGVDLALKAFAGGSVSKVVLARRVLLALSSSADPLALLHGIRQFTGPCFQFCGSHGAGFAFVGASPERLFRRAGRALDSEAVAGTRPRGASDAEDAALEAALRASGKESHEHCLVRDRIVKNLEGISECVASADHPDVLKLGRVQHLRTTIKATLKPGFGDAELLARLHPTPATAGEPVQAALKLLGELEPFDRGWYAGPVGWVGRDASEFAVALRCGLVAPKRLMLFAGAGVVPGSDAESEAREIENKLESFLRLLNSP